MLKDFILNITLLISFFAITGQIIKNVPRVRISSFRMKIGMGVGLGILGVILMKFSINVTPTLIADLRHLAIIVAALYGGITSSMIASGVIAIGRITLIPWSDAAIVILLNMMLIGIVCGLFSYASFSHILKSFFMNIISLIFITLSFYLILDNKHVLLDILPYHYATSLIGGMVAFHLVEYILHSNDASRRTKESEERYRRLVVQSPDPMIIHDREVILFANDKAVTLLGASDYSEVVGKSIYYFIQPDFHKLIADRVQNIYATQQQVGRVEIKIINLEGRVIDIEISSNFISYLDKLTSQVTFRDITERKRMVEALKESEERYRFIADNSTDLISILTAEGKTLYHSPACTPLLGYSPHELVGRSFIELVHSDDRSKITNLDFINMNEVDHATFSYQVLRKDGQYIWLETTTRTIRNEDGKLHHILAVSRNITERKRFEENLVESNRRLQKLSTLDGLTGIPNRRYFDEILTMEWSRAARTSASLSVILLDIDYFKNYNDTYGHQAGDDCLIKVAQGLQKSLQRSSDFVARYGGEEFVVILPETDGKGASIVAELLRKKIEELQIPHAGSEISHYVTVSLGVASTVPHFHANPQELIAEADKMLYKAKEVGRNRYIL